MASNGGTGLSISVGIEFQLHELWKAYRDGDAEGHNSFLTRDYRAVHPDGTVRDGHPTAQDIAAAPITGYALSDVRVVPVAAGAALVTYMADVKVPGGAQGQFAVGELWVNEHDEWKCRYYQGTLTKPVT